MAHKTLALLHNYQKEEIRRYKSVMEAKDVLIMELYSVINEHEYGNAVNVNKAKHELEIAEKQLGLELIK